MMRRFICALAGAVCLSASGAFGSPPNFTIGAPAGALGFGSALALGDLNGDQLLDLAVGAPDGDGGSVYVFYGNSSGFSQTPDWSYTLPSASGSLLGSGLLIVNANSAVIDPETEAPDNYNDLAVLVRDASGELRPYVFLNGANGLAKPVGLPDAMGPSTAIEVLNTLGEEIDKDGFVDAIYGEPELGRVSVRYADTPGVNDPPCWRGAEVNVKPEGKEGDFVAYLEAFDPENRGVAGSVE
ncbi:hypothetical protein FDZ71_02655, partial [bacterium]